MIVSAKFAAAFATSMMWCTGAVAEETQSFREKGIELSFGYVSETATNVQGGDRALWRYADQWTYGAAFDLQELFGLEQAKFQITLTDRNGRNLSHDAHLGSLQEVQEIYGRGQTWRWTQFHYQQKYLDGMLDWKIGRLVGGEDFADFSCEFMNLTLCGPPPGNITIDYWYNWPVSQWATRLKASFKRFGYVQVGVYEANPSYLQTRNGLNLGEPGRATGVLIPLEIGWQPTFGDRLGGTYKFGVWHNSSKAPDVVENTDRKLLVLDGGQPLRHNGHSGAYVNFLQQLTSPSDAGFKRGASVFFNATFNDRKAATLDNQIAAGLFYTGLLRLRPTDEFGFAIGRTHVNSRVRAAQRLLNAVGPDPVPLPASEYASELFYSVRAASGFELRPSIQFIRQRPDIGRNPDAVIIGVRLSVNL
jgi:porin